MGISSSIRTGRTDVKKDKWVRLSDDDTLIANTSIVMRCNMVLTTLYFFKLVMVVCLLLLMSYYQKVLLLV